MARGGAPPVGAVVAAAVDLLLVDPVELAVQQLRAAVGGEPALAPVIDVHYVEVVAADEADQLAVRAEGELLLRLHRRGEPLGPALRVERDVIEIVVDGDDGGGARRVHLEGAAGKRAADHRRVEPERVGGAIAGRLGLEERRRRAGRRLDLHPLHAAARRTRPEVLGVGDPRQASRRPAAEVDPRLRVVEVVDGEGARLRERRGRCDRQGEQDRGSETHRELLDEESRGPDAPPS